MRYKIDGMIREKGIERERDRERERERSMKRLSCRILLDRCISYKRISSSVYGRNSVCVCVCECVCVCVRERETD